jgi:hypothetical protein
MEKLIKLLDFIPVCIDLCLKMNFAKKKSYLQKNSYNSLHKILLLYFSYKIGRENNLSLRSLETFLRICMETLMNLTMLLKLL